MSIKAWTRRDYISFFLFSVLVGDAIKESLTNVNRFIEQKFELSMAYIAFWALPAIFGITLIRFYIGNTLYLRYLSEEKKAVAIWALSFLIMLFQFIVLTLISLNLKPDLLSKGKFFWMVLILLISDIVWIIILYIFKKSKASKSMEYKIAIPRNWLLLDIIGTLYLATGYICYNSEFYTSDIHLFSMSMIFILLGIIDLYDDFLRVVRQTID
jgi:hypothetical protein